MTTIVPFSSGDLPQLLKIMKEFPKKFSTQELTSYEAEMKDFPSKKLSGEKKILCLKDGERVLGGICFARDFQSDTYGYIAWIAIDNNQQGKGLGTQLLEAAFQGLREMECRYVLLKTVGTDYNQNAVQFYEKRGFTLAGTLPGYYLQPYRETFAEEDCLVYFKKL
jgi:ribosomal protein S18 acetylase RimI-like enzyme